MQLSHSFCTTAKKKQKRNKKWSIDAREFETAASSHHLRLWIQAKIIVCLNFYYYHPVSVLLKHSFLKPLPCHVTQATASLSQHYFKLSSIRNEVPP